MLGIKLRVGLLALVAMLLLGSLLAAPAFAAIPEGPYCHHRAAGGKGEGSRITEAEPEEIQGGGGAQTVTSKVLGLAITLEAIQVQIKGIIYNNPDQCQIKELIDFHLPHVTSPTDDTGCEVTINKQNSIKLFGHQALKWAGQAKELTEEHPLQHRDWIFLPVELQQGAKELPKTEVPFALITLSKKGTGECVTPIEAAPVKGSYSAEGFALGVAGEPNQALEVFATEEEITSTLNGGAVPQQIWNGKEQVGVQTGLFLSTEPAKYKGAFKVKPIGTQKHAAEEIAYFEK
jgi:hypothetical protein